jgi:hypothetical protein
MKIDYKKLDEFFKSEDHSSEIKDIARGAVNDILNGTGQSTTFSKYEILEDFGLLKEDPNKLPKEKGFFQEM